MRTRSWIALSLFAPLFAACPAPTPSNDASTDAAPADAPPADVVTTDSPITDSVATDSPIEDSVVVDAADAQPGPDAPALDALVLDAPALDVSATDAPAPDAADVVAPSDAAPTGPTFCSLGSDVAGLRAPAGFCIRRYARVDNARTLTFAPNGDLFVGAPRAASPGSSGTGGVGGPGAVMIVTDDNRDGVGEVSTFASSTRNAAGAVASGIATVHGVAIGGGYLYFTTEQQVFRTPYRTGQRTETPNAVESLNLPSETFGNATAGAGRWTHGLAASTDGTVYASRGQYGSCGVPLTGSIFTAAPSRLAMVSTGFRNPMYLRCHFADPLCMATELGEDGQTGAVEKLVEILPSTDYGYPCCQSRGRGLSGAPSTDCDARAVEARSFRLGDTPFGFDWERGAWPETHRGAVFVALHGSYYTSSPRFVGASIRFARTSPTTHLPTEDFVTFMGREDGIGEGLPIVRPSDAAFAPDGRLFVSDDHGHGIYWIAPTTLRMAAR